MLDRATAEQSAADILSEAMLALLDARDRGRNCVEKRLITSEA